MSKVGVVLLFDRQTEDLAAGHASRLDAKHLASDQLRLGKGAIPHLSLCHAVLLPPTLARAEIAIRELAEAFRSVEMRPLSGTLSSIRLYDEWIFWLAARTPELDRLHEAVVEEICAMRDGAVPIAWKMNAEQQRMHERFGFPSVMRCFNPHVTLGVLKPECVIDEFGRRRYETEAARYFAARSIALGPVGAHGQLMDVWYEAPLLN